MLSPLFSLLVCFVAVSNALGTSVSGISSGAYMAVQYEFAHSSEIVGVGIFAGGPYYCAKGSLSSALVACMTSPTMINLSTLVSATNAYAAVGKIDPVANVHNHKIYIFSGTLDATVVPGVVRKAEQLYLDLGVSADKITTDYSLQAGHTFPTNDWGNACTETRNPYISNCAYDGAGAALNTIYGQLNTPVPALTQNLNSMAINQFVPSGETPASMSMDSTMYYYSASYCNGNCTVHVAFHGCQMTFADVGLDFVNHAGYNKWAEANNMVILYPFTVRSSFLPSNPNGCWDWWGFDSANYAIKTGPQIVTIRNIIKYFEAPH